MIGTLDRTNGVSNSSPIGANRFFTFGRQKQKTSTGTITGSPVCAGSAVSVPFTIVRTYNSRNVFTAQLSNAIGYFTTPISLGTLTGITAGTILGTIPSLTPYGSGYRIRVISSNPTITGSINSTNITINAINTLTLSSGTGTNIQEVCANNAIVAITYTTTGATGFGIPVNLPSGVTASWAANQITITGTPTVEGTFNYSIPLTGGCGNVNATGTIIVNDGVVTTTFNGTSWDKAAPDITKKAIFMSDYDTSIYGNITACNCEVNSLATLTIAPDKNVINRNNIINNGNIVVESDGNLMQINNAGTYSGTATNFTVNRIANVKRFDYVYWSSPVENRNIKMLSPITSNSGFLVYDEAADYLKQVFLSENIATAVFTVGKGYAILAKNNQSETVQDWVGQFKGKPNNGITTFSLQWTRIGYNLVGNPYPSNITLEGNGGLFEKNTGVIAPIAYFWNNVVPNVDEAGENYDGANYAVFHKAG